MVGAARSSPRPPGAPRAPKSAISRWALTVSLRESPRPYAPTGRLGADQPARPSRCHHSPTVRSGSQFSASQVRSSSTRSSPLLVGEAVSVVSVVSVIVSPGSGRPAAADDARAGDRVCRARRSEANRPAAPPVREAAGRDRAGLSGARCRRSRHRRRRPRRARTLTSIQRRDRARSATTTPLPLPGRCRGHRRPSSSP